MELKVGQIWEACNDDKAINFNTVILNEYEIIHIRKVGPDPIICKFLKVSLSDSIYTNCPFKINDTINKPVSWFTRVNVRLKPQKCKLCQKN